MKLTKSSAAVSSQGAVAADIASVQVPILELTYSTTLSWSFCSSADDVRVGVDGVRVQHLAVPADDLPLPADLLQVEVDQRQPHTPLERLGQHHLLAGDLVRDEPLGDLQVRVADQDGVDARDGLGHQHRRVLRVPAARRRTTRTGPSPSARRRSPRRRRPCGPAATQILASSTMPPNLILFSTFALSQIAMPGLVRPRMPTVIGFSPGTWTRFSTYGGNTGRPGGPVLRVRAEQREPQLPLELAQDVEAVVELVVAERGGVVPDPFIAAAIGCSVTTGDGLDLGEVVRQRGALDGVAGVEHQRGRRAPVRGDPVADRA